MSVFTEIDLLKTKIRSLENELEKAEQYIDATLYQLEQSEGEKVRYKRNLEKTRKKLNRSIEEKRYYRDLYERFMGSKEKIESRTEVNKVLRGMK